VGPFWVTGHSGVQGNEIANKLTRDGTVPKYVGPENIRRKIKCWIDNQHMVMWWGLISSQRQAQKMILGPGPTAKTRILSFNRTQSRVITCLFTGRNTLRRHHYLMGLTNSYAGGLEQRNKPHPTFCVSVKLWLHSDMRIWAPFFLDSEDVKSLSLGAIWNFNIGTGLPLLGIRLWGTKGRLKA
jgi:hypothetical protein